MPSTDLPASSDRSNSRRAAFWTIFAFYGLVAFEFFYMAGPFAAYFYSVYRPGLALLDRLPGGGWLAGFFLPHLAEDTHSVVFNVIRPVGIIGVAAGLVVFGICAGQVYWAKLRRSGPVTAGLYRLVRHPQYTAFTVCSTGLLLLWPRYLTLALLVTLLFAYYLLARAEEQECSRRYGPAYDDAVRDLPRFLPFGRSPAGSLVKPRPWLLLAAYVSAVTIALATARQVKYFSARALYTSSEADAVRLAISACEPATIDAIVRLARDDLRVADALHRAPALAERQIGATDAVPHSAGAPGDAEKWIIYVVPSDLFLSEIPMTERADARSHMDHRPEGTGIFTVVFARATGVPAAAEGVSILEYARGTVGVVEARVDWNARRVLEVRPSPPTHRYGNTPEPVF